MQQAPNGRECGAAFFRSTRRSLKTVNCPDPRGIAGGEALLMNAPRYNRFHARIRSHDVIFL
jgi:hypothetical protein